MTDLGEIGVFNRINWPQGSHQEEHFHWMGRLTEWYFDLGQQKYQVLPDNFSEGVPVIPYHPKKMPWIIAAFKVIGVVLKIFSWFTVIIPLIMLMGKCLYRSENRFVSIPESMLASPENDGNGKPRRKLVEQGAKVQNVMTQQLINQRNEETKRNILEQFSQHFAKDIIDPKIEKLKEKIEALKCENLEGLNQLLYLHREISGLRSRTAEYFKNGLPYPYLDEDQVKQLIESTDKVNDLNDHLSKQVRDNPRFRENYKLLEDQIKAIPEGESAPKELEDQFYVMTTIFKQLDNSPTENSYEEDLYQRIKARIAPLGIRNHVNSCYLNSILQVLMAVPDLTNLEPNNVVADPMDNVLEMLGNFSKDYVKKVKVKDPSDIGSDAWAYLVRDSLHKAGKIEGKLSSQQDAARILREILADKYLEQPIRKYAYYNQIDGTEKVKEFREENMPAYQLEMKDNEGKLFSSTFQGLVDHAFEFESSTEPLTIEDQNNPPQTITEWKMKTLFQKAPEYLVIELKRFCSQVVENQQIQSKVDDVVLFPDNEVVDFGCAMSPQVLQNEETHLYEPVAISHHFGGYDGGHYTATVKKGRIWYSCSDNTVKEMGFTNPDLGSGYLYVFKRVPNGAIPAEVPALQPAEVPVVQPADE